jgi:hypothetical protein
MTAENNTVEIFKTNVQETGQAAKLVPVLLEHFPLSKITFDLDDCDKVLRIEGLEIHIPDVIRSLNSAGYSCELME